MIEKIAFSIYCADNDSAEPVVPLIFKWQALSEADKQPYMKRATAVSFIVAQREIKFRQIIESFWKEYQTIERLTD